MNPSKNSLNYLARLADVLVVCAVRFKFQIGIQTLQLSAILVSAPISIR